jgi:hypothetical protein
MATKIPLGPRGPVVGALDNTGRNVGNWTVVFDPAILNCNMPYFEVCHALVQSPSASVQSFSVGVDLHLYSAANQGLSNEWDPTQPMPVRPGQTVYFYYNESALDGTPPTVTLWLQYDGDIAANAQAFAAGVK